MKNVIHVHPWLIHVNVWQNQYSIIKQNKLEIKIFKKCIQITNRQLTKEENLVIRKIFLMFTFSSTEEIDIKTR